MVEDEPPNWNYWCFVIGVLELLLQVMSKR
jgi:hypothetical protein